MPINSLFASRNSLFLRNNSLFPNRRVPHQSTVKWRLFRLKGNLGGPDSAKFPVIFPVSREFTVENGSRPTASTASRPYELLSPCQRLDFHPVFPAVVPRHALVRASIGAPFSRL